MKLFRSKSQSSPSKPSRLGRMLSPTSKKSHSNLNTASPAPSFPARPPSAPPAPNTLLPDLDFEPFPTPLAERAQHEAELNALRYQQHRDQAKENQSPDTIRHKTRNVDEAEEMEQSHVGTDFTAPFDERAMTRKLNDMESSFIPEHETEVEREREREMETEEELTFEADAERFPFKTGGAMDSSVANAQYVNNRGAAAEDGEEEGEDRLRMAKSQTFLKWGPGYSLPRSPSAKIGSRVISVGFRPHGSVQDATGLEADGAEQEQEDTRPRTMMEDEDEVDYGDSLPESPTIAAAQRYDAGTVHRQVQRQVDTEDGSPSPPVRELAVRDVTVEQNGSATRATIAQLRDRHVSQLSTFSYQSEAYTESTMGADYALQTGGATSDRLRVNRPTRDDISRLPSFGSVASSLGEPVKTSVIQRPVVNGRGFINDVEHTQTSQVPQVELATPRAQRQPLFDPTETVLNQRVRDVQVPETVARQYRASHLSAASMDDMRTQPTPSYGLSKNNLTLKEQNSKIDKLTKENFDLKLKIHFLTQALQHRSEEGVRDLISKNAQYQAELVRSKKENQTLKKRIRVLEKQLGAPERGSIASTATASQADSEEDSAPQAQHNNDAEEVARLQERNLTLQTENEKLLQVWQEVLDEEINRRRAAEDKFQKLQEDFAKYKTARSPLRKLNLRGSRARLGDDESSSAGRLSEAQERTSSATQDRIDLSSLGGSTVVDQLRQENNTLRRDLDVQTDMLSSRNRERERLQQEIETLKLITRREESAKSSNGDSILERSISRQQLRGRPASRDSPGRTSLSDVERERYDSLLARLRDENAALKIRINDMQNDMDDLERLHVPRADADQALQEADADIQYLTDAVRHLESVLQEKDSQINGLWGDLRAREEENDAFKRELESISASLEEVAGDRDGTQHLINNLQQELDSTNVELETLEATLRNVKAAKERLEVQQESAQNEIAFLREEQESDKLKIGDLQTSLGNVNTNLQNEIERLKQFEQLEAEAADAREEGHRLRQALVLKETEAAAQLDEIQSLEKHLQDAQQANASAVSADEVHRLHLELEAATSDLNHATADLREKDRMILEREDLLDQMEAELKHARHLNKQSSVADARLARLEQTHGKEIERYTALLTQRNTLLHTLHNRLTALCGSSFKSRAQQDPTLASHNLPLLQQSLTSALAHLENTIKSFPTRLHDLEQDIWVDFQTLDKALASRMGRLDQLEGRVKSAGPGKDEGRMVEELKRIRRERDALRAEMQKLQNNTLPSTTSASTNTNNNPAQAGALTTTRPPTTSTTGTLTSTTSTHDPSASSASQQDPNNEAKWIWRIEEMNRRLKAEREGRLLDRDGASKRLLEGQREIRELKRLLERAGAGRGSGGGGVSAGEGGARVETGSGGE